MLPPKWEAGAGGGEGGHYPGQARRPLSVSTPTAQPTGGALELAEPQAGLSAPITALREQWRPWGPAVKFKGPWRNAKVLTDLELGVLLPETHGVIWVPRHLCTWVPFSPQWG